eukprot:1190712-Amphidinium_carterae.2
MVYLLTSCVCQVGGKVVECVPLGRGVWTGAGWLKRLRALWRPCFQLTVVVRLVPQIDVESFLSMVWWRVWELMLRTRLQVEWVTPL